MRTQGDLEKAKEPLGMWGTGSVHSHILVHYGSFLSVLPLFQFQKGTVGKTGKARDSSHRGWLLAVSYYFPETE